MTTMRAPGSGQPKHPGSTSFARVALATCALLSLPAVAMFFTDEVKWGPGDFLVAAVLLGGTGLLLEFAVMRLPTLKRRVLAGGAVVLALLFVWVELAVGIVGSPFAGS